MNPPKQRGNPNWSQIRYKGGRKKKEGPTMFYTTHAIRVNQIEHANILKLRAALQERLVHTPPTDRLLMLYALDALAKEWGIPLEKVPYGEDNHAA